MTLPSRRFFGEVKIISLSFPPFETPKSDEIVLKLKASPVTASIPIPALSAHAMSGDQKKALDSGCSDFDSKPVNLPRLLGKIEALLKRSEQPAA